MASGSADYTQEGLDADASTNLVPDEDPNHTEHNQGLTTRLYLLSWEGLQRLCRRRPSTSWPKSRLSTLKEELGILYLWGEVFENGKLDEVLEQSEDLRDIVLELLCAIGNTVIRASSPSPTLTVESAATPKQIQDLKLLTDQSKLITFSDGIPGSTESSEDEEEYGASKDRLSDGGLDIAEDLQFHIACLVDLGSTLEQSLLCIEKGLVRSSQVEPVPFRVSDAAKAYVLLVRDKFKEAEVALVERLGEANWQRHVNVRLRMEDISNGVEKEHIREDPCSTFRPYSAFHDSGIGTSVPAQTQYAPSHTSFNSSDTEREEGRLRVPREPVEVGAGKPFQCYLCGDVLSNHRNRVDWKLHVFADLQPYICTFTGCEDELVQFSSRAAWADHEFSKHRINRFWDCPECSNKSSSAVDWEEHLLTFHQRTFSRPRLQIANHMAYKPQPRPVESEECPLCRVVLGKPRRAFVKHVGRHMEEIALVALPRDNPEDSDRDSISTGQLSTLHSNQPLSPASVWGPKIVGPVLPRDPTHATGDEDEDYIIKCICGFRDDDGNTVYCDLCDTWQHTECYYYKHGNVPTKEELEVIDHFCADCQPRSLNAKGAIERQRIRRQELDPDDRKVKKTTAKSHKKKTESQMETEYNQSSLSTEASLPKSTRNESTYPSSSKSSHRKEKSSWVLH